MAECEHKYLKKESILLSNAESAIYYILDTYAFSDTN